MNQINVKTTHEEIRAQYGREVGAHNVGTCKHCGAPYKFNNMSHHDKGYCSRDCFQYA